MSANAETDVERAKEAFDENGASAFAPAYLDGLWAGWNDAARAARRTGTILVSLVVGFILLTHAKNTAFTLGPLKLTDITSVLILVPAIASVFLYELYVLEFAQVRYGEVSLAVVGQVYPAVRKSGLDVMLRPATASLWGNDGWRGIRLKKSGIASVWLRRLQDVVLLALLVGVIGFLAYAYWTLYKSHHANTIAVSSSLAFSAFNVLRVALLAVDTVP